MKQSLKALTLIGLGLFLYSRFVSGTLLFYINRRFAWLTFLAALGLLVVGASYRYRPADHHDHEHAGHTHAFSWTALLMLLLPIVLGLLFPPKPLGASAMGNREINISSFNSAITTGKTTALVPGGNKTILDWLNEFSRTPDAATFAGEEADIIGFVYRDGRFGPDTFMASRFVVSCCVADATAIGLIVRWPDAASLSKDQWVQVTGHFEPGAFSNEQVPILVADSVTPTDAPNHPYLYP